MKIGIMAAMPEEVKTIHDDFNLEDSENYIERDFYFGQFGNIELVLVYGRCGKVSAATTATCLLEKYKVDEIIFTGVAGGVDPLINIGDIVLANSTYQHDMDARPLFPRFEVPLTNRALFSPQDEITQRFEQGIKNFIEKLDNYVAPAVRQELNVANPQLQIGTIATGDQFIQDPLSHEGLKFAGSKVLAVEMEGAAVAQTCAEYKKPYSIIRTISDKADHSAALNFQEFIAKVASHYSSGIIRETLELM